MEDKKTKAGRTGEEKAMQGQKKRQGYTKEQLVNGSKKERLSAILRRLEVLKRKLWCGKTKASTKNCRSCFKNWKMNVAAVWMFATD